MDEQRQVSHRCQPGRRRARRLLLNKLAASACLMLALAIALAALQVAESRIAQAQQMQLPDGIEHILGFVPRSSFQCERDGYFGDIDNDCKLFHLCQRNVNSANGLVEWRHWTYACGNQTMFNQLTLTCAFVDEAIPCRHASQFQYLNEVIHKPAEPFLTDADVTSGFSYYSNRVMSDGARARAFQDSRLFAQLGGPPAPPAGQPLAAAASSSSATQLNSIAERSDRQALNEAPSGARGHQAPDQTELGARSIQSHFQPVMAALGAGHFQQRQQFQPAHHFHFQHQPAASGEQALASVQPQQPQQQPQVFEFSIATNHQSGPGGFASAPSSGSNNNQALSSHQLQQFFAPPPPPPASTNEPASQQPPVASATTSVSLQPQTTTASLSLDASTSQPPLATGSTTSGAAATLPPAGFTAPRQQLVQPTPATLATVAPATQAPTATTATSTTTASTTTTTTTTTTATVRRASSQAPAPARQQRPAQSQAQAQAQARRQAADPRTRAAGFQSTRLSALNRRTAAAAETPLVMRRPAGSAASAAQAAQAQAAQAPSQASGDFWRRSNFFDAQLMAPKFESLLLRRRV